jgi:membrane protease subunit (stomatin/prohibitin family)
MSIINVIEWNGSPSELAWRHPNSAIMLGSQLVVQEYQHAFLLKEGRMIGPFLPGRHTLDTKNIPVLKGLIGLATGGRTPFPAECWFVNRTVDLSVRWGTSTPIQVKDPTYNIMIPVQGYGSFGVTVAESKRFLLKLVGSLRSYDRETVETHFRGILLSSIKTHIAKSLDDRKLSILDMAAHLSEFSVDLERLFQAEFAEFGLSIVAFRIESITTLEDDDAVKRLRRALAKRAEYQILGTDYTQAESFAVLKKAAASDGGAVGPFVGAGLGLGIGASIGGQAGSLAGQLSTQGARCAACGTQVPPASRFCPGCGQGVGPSPTADACRSCRSSVPAGARYCPQCGVALGIPCEGCKATLPSRSRFCPECGTAAPVEKR